MQIIKKPGTKILSDDERVTKYYFSIDNPPTSSDMNYPHIITPSLETELGGWYFSSKFSKIYETIIANIIEPYIADMHFEIQNLKSKLEVLTRENNILKHRFDKFQNEKLHQSNFDEPEVIKIKELSDKKIEKIILKFLKKNEEYEVFPSDIAFKYNLDARRVYEIAEKLKKEGKISWQNIQTAEIQLLEKG